MPGMNHWQSPRFHGYFPANNSYPSVLAEMITAGLGTQCMMWETSPAATELEEKVMIWLRDMIGLPSDFAGVIQDTASTANLVAILTAREKYSEFKVNSSGLINNKFRVYCSEEAHSSIEKAVKIAGIGSKNLVKIAVNDKFEIKYDELQKAINKDIKDGFIPLCIVGALGTTGSTAVDSMKELSAIAKENNIWLHIDAAYAGSAMIIPEKRHYLEGIENVDSFVFNPHKWMFTNFDCSAYFVKDKESLIKTFEIMPEYLKTAVDSQVNNYRDWGIQLGRRFRALKLWFVIRTFGVKQLQEIISNHMKFARRLARKIDRHDNFEVLAPVNFNVICFRFAPLGVNDETEINKINENLVKKINSTGKMFVSHTKLKGKYAIRMVIGQTYIEEHHVLDSWETILSLVEKK
jgi:aromatic-L-amino-acid decarboxylase